MTTKAVGAPTMIQYNEFDKHSITSTGHCSGRVAQGIDDLQPQA